MGIVGRATVHTPLLAGKHIDYCVCMTGKTQKAKLKRKQIQQLKVTTHMIVEGLKCQRKKKSH